MGEINLTTDEMDAIKAIDDGQLRKLIDQCLQEERIYPLRVLQLERCGDFVAARQREFDRAFSDLAKAKAPKKVADMEQRARRAGGNLDSAVHQMRHRSKEEEEERQLFFVDDHIIQPTRFDENLSVRVSYRWRKTAEDDWAHGSITFLHETHKPIDYLAPKPKRKPPAWKVEQEKQEWLYGQWEHLMKSGLHSLREFFREGGRGPVVPRSFQAKSGIRGELNNHSTDFWR